jgi:hypothetical protein
VLRQHARDLLRGPASAHAKLDAISELMSLGPAVHFGLVVLLATIAWLLTIPGWLYVVALLALTLIRVAVYTLLGIGVDPQPVRAAMSFLYLPVYTVWRLAVQVRALGMLGNKPWIRTARHSGAAVELSSHVPSALE